MTVGFDQRIATRYVFAPSVLELILNVAGVAIVDGVVELILGRTDDKFVGMARDDPSLDAQIGAQEQAECDAGILNQR